MWFKKRVEEDGFGNALVSKITFRTRLTVTYSVLLTVFGLVTVGGVYLFMKFVPNYSQLNYAESDAFPDFGKNAEGAVLREDGTVVYWDGSEILGDGLVPAETKKEVNISLFPDVLVTDSGDVLRVLFFVSLGVVFLLVLVGSFASWLIAKRMLAPLQAIDRAAKLAATGALDHRVELLGPKDELHSLSDTFNNMLSKLEKSFLAAQRFTANASHELRTPLSTTKVLVDVALSDPKSVDEQYLLETLGRVREVNEKSIVLVESLLDLSVTNIDCADFVEVDLGFMFSQVAEELAVDLVDAGVVLELPEGVGCVVLGDEVLLHRLWFNLLQNAVRYNVVGGSVVVEFFVENDLVNVRVSNTGEVVSGEDVKVLVEPFFKGAGRVSGGFRDKSYGLGLALVDNIVQLHGGSLCIVPNVGGGIVVDVFLLGEGVGGCDV